MIEMQKRENIFIFIYIETLVIAILHIHMSGREII